MTRLIDADTLQIRAEYGYNDNGLLLVPLRDVKRSIDNAPTIDAEPVRRDHCYFCEIMENGRGKVYENGDGWRVIIGRNFKNHEMLITHKGNHFVLPIEYCPYCGAKMDLKED